MAGRSSTWQAAFRLAADGNMPPRPGCRIPSPAGPRAPHGRRSAARLPQGRDGRHSSTIASIGRRGRSTATEKPLTVKRRRTSPTLLYLRRRWSAEKGGTNVTSWLQQCDCVFPQINCDCQRPTRFSAEKRDFHPKNVIFRRKTRFSSDERDFRRKNVIFNRQTRFSGERRVSTTDERDFRAKNEIFVEKTG